MTNDNLMQAKAQAVLDDAGIENPQAAGGFGAIIQFILSLLTGLSACKPPGTVPTPTQIRDSIVNPDRRQERGIKRASRKHIPNPALRPAIEDGAKNVTASSTDDELIALYKQANGIDQ